MTMTSTAKPRSRTSREALLCTTLGACACACARVHARVCVCEREGEEECVMEEGGATSRAAAEEDV